MRARCRVQQTTCSRQHARHARTHGHAMQEPPASRCAPHRRVPASMLITDAASKAMLSCEICDNGSDGAAQSGSACKRARTGASGIRRKREWPKREWPKWGRAVAGTRAASSAVLLTAHICAGTSAAGADGMDHHSLRAARRARACVHTHTHTHTHTQRHRHRHRHRHARTHTHTYIYKRTITAFGLPVVPDV